MPLITKIKAGNITNLSDARYFSTFTEWIGFCLDEAAPHHLDKVTAKEIMDWVTGPEKVGEFGNQPVEVINEWSQALMLETIQTATDLDASRLQPPVSRIIRRIDINEWVDADRLESILMAQSGVTTYFLLNFGELSWSDLQQHPHFYPAFLREMCENYPIMLQLAFSTKHVVETVHELTPLALNIAGGNELKTGLRSFEDIEPVIEQLEIDND